MKTIALVALLAASLAGCSKKADSDCDAPINKGMDNFTAMLKGRGSSSPIAPAQLGVFEAARAVFLKRCHEDKWAPEVAACFGTVQNQRDVVACESKLTEDQRTQLHLDLRESRKGAGHKMPNLPGHPQYLQGSSPMSGAPALGSDGQPLPAAGSAAPVPAPAAGSGSGSGSATPAGGW